MRFGADRTNLPMLRVPRPDYKASSISTGAEHGSAQRRLDEFVQFFRDRGDELLTLRDPMVALSVGAALNAPFMSISDLRGRMRALVLEVVADGGCPRARAALLALAAASDGDMGELAGRAAAGMAGRFPEPPWIRPARRPVRTVRVDVHTDREDPRVRALLFTVVSAGSHAAFFLRFHRDSALAEQIFFMPGVKRSDVLRSLEAGTGPIAPHRYSPPADFTGDLIGLVNSITGENELNLRMRGGFRTYPPSLVQVDRIDSVTVAPALLVLLRKFVASANGIADWSFRDGGSLWC
jgi:hypothetical protein